MLGRGVLHGVELPRYFGWCTREELNCARVAFMGLFLGYKLLHTTIHISTKQLKLCIGNTCSSHSPLF